MRLILAATLLSALALPAHAQRLDDRVREVSADGMRCRLNANRAMLVERDDDGPQASLFQPPVEPDTAFNVTLGFSFGPRPGTRFGVGARVVMLQLLPLHRARPAMPSSARLLIDGADSGVRLRIETNPDRAGSAYLTVPEEVRAETAEKMLRAHWIDFLVTGGDSARARTYRFDAFRISNAAETLSLIRFGCGGPRAD